MKVVIEVPKWLLRLNARIRYWGNSIKWIVTPPRCEECGARLHAKHYHMLYNHKDNGTRLMVENHGEKKLCHHCIAKEVANTTPSSSSVLFEHDVDTTCDCCQKENTKAYRFYETNKIRLHYCLQWWNGFHICKECTLNALQNGKVQTGYTRFVDGKGYTVGSYGLFLNDKGKVQLFKWSVW